METAHHGQQASCHTNGKIIRNAPTKVAVRQFFWAKSTKQYLKGSLSNSYCWDLNKVTMAGEGSYSLLVDGLTWEMIVSSYDGWSFRDILKLYFGQDLEVEVWLRFWCWSLVNILRLKVGWDFEAEFWSRLWSWFLVKILRLKFGWDSEAEFWWICNMIKM